MELCKYGCGNEGKFETKNGKCCSDHFNRCPENIRKNSEALKRKHQEGIKFNTFTDEDRQKSIISSLEKGAKVALIENSSFSNGAIVNFLRKLNLKDYKCDCCKCVTWLDKEISLELHHLNGIRTDNRIENLQFLCPNCHSQTENFRGKNINTGKEKVSDEVLIEAIKTSCNVRQALLKVGLAGKGLNYDRVYELVNEHKLVFLKKKAYDSRK